MTPTPKDPARKEPPDGWVAWHVRHGIDKTSFAARESLVAAEMGIAHERSVHVGHVHALDRGWRIRPVKLVFLDEEK